MSKKFDLVIDNYNKCDHLFSGNCENEKCPYYDKKPGMYGIDCTEGSCEFYEEESGII